MYEFMQWWINYEKEIHESDTTEFVGDGPKFRSKYFPYLLWFSSVTHAHPHPYPCQMRKSTAEIGSPFLFVYTLQQHWQKINFRVFFSKISVSVDSTSLSAKNFSIKAIKSECVRRAFVTFSVFSSIVICFSCNCNLKLPNNTRLLFTVLIVVFVVRFISVFFFESTAVFFLSTYQLFLLFAFT